MKLEKITFETARLDTIPDTITVTMSSREALWIAKVAGKTPSPSTECSAIYDCLVGDVFNRYFEDGLKDAEECESTPVKIPKISEHNPE